MDHDPRWAASATALLTDIHTALAGLPGASEAVYDHIGSTSVPGLAAKPYLDLQVRILPLPSHPEIEERLRPLGFERALG